MTFIMVQSFHSLLLCLTLIVKVIGTLMSINPSIFVINTGISSILKMTCELTPAESNIEVDSFLYIKIERNKKQTINNSRETIAVKLQKSQAILNDGLLDITNRTPNVTGNLMIGYVNASPPKHHRVDLTLTWDSQVITCEDEGEYYCLVGVLDTAFRNQIWSSSAELIIETTSSTNQSCRQNRKLDRKTGKETEDDDNTVVYIVGGCVGMVVTVAAVVAVLMCIRYHRSEGLIKSLQHASQ